MNTPIADIGEGQVSVQTLMPLDIVVTSRGLTYFNGSGISPLAKSPRYEFILVLVNYDYTLFLFRVCS